MAKPQQIARSIRGTPQCPLLSRHPLHNRHKTARQRCLEWYISPPTLVTTPHPCVSTRGEIGMHSLDIALYIKIYMIYEAREKILRSEIVPKIK